MAINKQLNVIIKGKDEASKAFESVGEEAGRTDSKLNKMAKAGLKAVGVGAIAAGAALSGLVVASVKVSAEFEKSMSNVKAVTNATGAEMAEMSKMARQMGRDTAFSAKESAEAMGFLGMAGFDTNQIMVALPATLNLAAAANMELGRAADIASNVLTGFSMPAQEAARVSDVMAKGAASANVSVEMLGDSFRYVGPIASSAGFAFEETAATIGLLGNAGIQGAQAGTTLRGALAKMLQPTKDTEEAMSRLGVSFKDSTGKMLPFENILGQLERTGADTTDMIQLFGVEAGPGMTALVSQGAGALRELTAELENSGGAAQKMADVQLDNLAGQMTILKSSYDEFLMSLGGGELGLKDWIKNGIIPTLNKISEFAEKLGGIPGIIETWTGIFRAQGGEIGAFFTGWTMIIQTFATGAVEIIATAAEIIWKPLINFGEFALSKVKQGFAIAWNFITKNIVEPAVNAIIDKINAIAGKFGLAIDKVDFTPLTVDAPKTFGEVWDKTTSDVKDSVESIGRTVDKTAVVIDAHLSEIDNAFGETSKVIQKTKDKLAEIPATSETMKTDVNADQDAIGQKAEDTAEVIERSYVGAFTEVGRKSEETASGMLGWLSSMGRQNTQTTQNVESEWIDFYDNMGVASEDTTEEMKLDILGIKDVVKDVFSAGGLKALVKPGLDALSKAVNGVVESLLGSVAGVGGTAKTASTTIGTAAIGLTGATVLLTGAAVGLSLMAKEIWDVFTNDESMDPATQMRRPDWTRRGGMTGTESGGEPSIWDVYIQALEDHLDKYGVLPEGHVLGRVSGGPQTGTGYGAGGPMNAWRKATEEKIAQGTGPPGSQGFYGKLVEAITRAKKAVEEVTVAFQETVEAVEPLTGTIANEQKALGAWYDAVHVVTDAVEEEILAIVNVTGVMTSEQTALRNWYNSIHSSGEAVEEYTEVINNITGIMTPEQGALRNWYDAVHFVVEAIEEETEAIQNVTGTMTGEQEALRSWYDSLLSVTDAIYNITGIMTPEQEALRSWYDAVHFVVGAVENEAAAIINITGIMTGEQGALRNWFNAIETSTEAIDSIVIPMTGAKDAVIPLTGAMTGAERALRDWMAAIAVSAAAITSIPMTGARPWAPGIPMTGGETNEQKAARDLWNLRHPDNPIPPGFEIPPTGVINPDDWYEQPPLGVEPTGVDPYVPGYGGGYAGGGGGFAAPVQTPQTVHIKFNIYAFDNTNMAETVQEKIVPILLDFSEAGWDVVDVAGVRGL